MTAVGYSAPTTKRASVSDRKRQMRTLESLGGLEALAALITVTACPSRGQESNGSGAFLGRPVQDDHAYAPGNPLNRYLINSPMLPQLSKNADGLLTLHIQKDSPGKDHESNWLPAPDGTFYVVLRIYWPKAEALDGEWKPSPIVPLE